MNTLAGKQPRRKGGRRGGSTQQAGKDIHDIVLTSFSPPTDRAMPPKPNKELSAFLWDPLSRYVAAAANRITSFIPPPPRAPHDPPRRVLLLHAHPLGANSYNGACLEATHRGLLAAGHEVKRVSLYDDQFQPCMRPEDLKDYMTAIEQRPPTAENKKLGEYIALLKWCDALVLAYPTWWYAMPAILKGWIERTFLPHAAFTLPGPGSPPPSVVGLVPQLQNITKVGVVTTYGSEWKVIRYVGDPGRRIISRGLRPLFHPECTLLWLGMYGCDAADKAAREAFLAKVEAYYSEF